MAAICASRCIVPNRMTMMYRKKRSLVMMSLAETATMSAAEQVAILGALWLAKSVRCTPDTDAPREARVVH